MAGDGEGEDRASLVLKRASDTCGLRYSVPRVQNSYSVPESTRAQPPHESPHLPSRVFFRCERLARLASSVRNAAKYFPQLAGSSATLAEVEVSGVLAESVAAITSAFDAVFSAVASISSAATIAVASSSKKPSASLISLVTRSSKAAAASSDEDKEMAALDRLEGLDECIANMEAGSDKVFRSILQTRVALLNIHTQTLLI
ncbi:hypothetical protein SETIT_5G188300v2 [Setaria italica]|uniref:Uncharacterized protein n=1 Tax=Setaria italica TaxID=4555 RepID=A0A368R6M1_SETIT|nr:hypothetical protein SETIT_5G188300v2 [Setaria italica]